MPRRVLNGIGALVVLIVFVAGALLIALPIILDALTTSGRTAAVAEGNRGYQAQVDRLRTEEEQLDEISARVDALREEIPATTHSDDVFDLVAQAASQTGATVVSVTAAEPQQWTPRTGIIDLADESADPIDPAAQASQGTDAEDGTVGSTGDGVVEPAEPSEQPEDPKRVQVPYIVQVAVPDAAQAAAFLDALGAGPRLLGIDNASLTSESGKNLLTVAVLSFVRGESG